MSLGPCISIHDCNTQLVHDGVLAAQEEKHRTEEWQSLLAEQAQRSEQSHSFSTTAMSMPNPRPGLSVRT